MVDSIEIPEVHSFADILDRAVSKAAGSKSRAALIWPDDTETIEAVIEAKAKGLLEPVIIADRHKVQALLTEGNPAANDMAITHVKDRREAMDAALSQAKSGEIEIIVQGQIPMGEMIEALTSPGSEFCAPGKTLSHVAVMKPEKYPKLLMLTDSAVVAAPDLSQKISLISNLVSVAKAISLDNPRIAVVAAVEAIYPHMPVTLDAAVLAKMADRGQIKGARVDGPLSFDVAIDMEAAQAKGIRNSSVAGQADAMLAPSIEVASGVYLAMSLYGNCDIGGVLVGGRVPIAANFPSDSFSSRFHSILLALLLA